jgi:hypothetical protein
MHVLAVAGMGALPCHSSRLPWVVLALRRAAEGLCSGLLGLQLADRFQQLLPSQPDRQHMCGLAWGKSRLAVWRFARPGTTSSETSGQQDFQWQQGNVGYQVSGGGVRGDSHQHAGRMFWP